MGIRLNRKVISSRRIFPGTRRNLRSNLGLKYKRPMRRPLKGLSIFVTGVLSLGCGYTDEILPIPGDINLRLILTNHSQFFEYETFQFEIRGDAQSNHIDRIRSTLDRFHPETIRLMSQGISVNSELNEPRMIFMVTNSEALNGVEIGGLTFQWRGFYLNKVLVFNRNLNDIDLAWTVPHEVFHGFTDLAFQGEARDEDGDSKGNLINCLNPIVFSYKMILADQMRSELPDSEIAAFDAIFALLFRESESSSPANDAVEIINQHPLIENKILEYFPTLYAFTGDRKYPQRPVNWSAELLAETFAADQNTPFDRGDILLKSALRSLVMHDPNDREGMLKNFSDLLEQTVSERFSWDDFRKPYRSTDFQKGKNRKQNNLNV